MKISKITIKQLFGIKEWQGDGKNIELVGDMLLQIPQTVNLS